MATEEIQRALNPINDEVRAGEIQSNEMKILFAEFIDAHGLIKQFSIIRESDWSPIPMADVYDLHFIDRQAIIFYFRVQHDFSDILQPIFMSLFTWSLLAISAAMFVFQLEIVE